MSFSANVKTELCQVRLDGPNARNALISGLVFSIGKRSGEQLRIGSEFSDVVKLALKLIRSGYAGEVSFRGDENSPFSKKKIYELHYRMSEAFQSAIVYEDYRNSEYVLESSLGYFLRGVFLGVGSVTDPHKSYHLELVFKEEWQAQWISQLLQSRYSLNAKIVSRKKSFVCYLKESENISDFLTIVGSVSSLLDYENTRVYKQVMNKINRAINCDTANINKATDAAIVQLEAIRILQEANALSKLGEKCIEIAELRIENPELSLTELGQLTYPPISKSGCNHRMKKIIEEAKRLRDTK